uniref:Uncharacterized protein n=1 Tax=Anguilla anguilla TaxID=7936 RepID=A0A0E9XDT2_ANGAN
MEYNWFWTEIRTEQTVIACNACNNTTHKHSFRFAHTAPTQCSIGRLHDILKELQPGFIFKIRNKTKSDLRFFGVKILGGGGDNFQQSKK